MGGGAAVAGTPLSPVPATRKAVLTGCRVWPCLAFSSAQTPFAVALPLLSSRVISVHQKNRAQTRG